MPIKPPKTTSTITVTYNGKVYTLPVLDYQGENYCQSCGKCCWDFKGNDPQNRCEHLGADLATCAAYAIKATCGGLSGNWPQPYHFVDLPDDCGYVVLWKSKGWVK